MVERVAREIAVMSPPDFASDQWHDFVDHARAAIKAMQEPTGPMIIAAMGETGLTAEVEDADDKIVIAWETMIHEALK